MFSEYLVGLNSGLTALLALLQGHSSPATTACQLLQEQIPSAVFFQGSDIYAAAVHHNSLSSQQNATCVVEPSTPEEVSTVIQIVGRADVRAPFSIKSGGHAFNPGHSSSPGVQISLEKFKHVDYDPETKTVRVGTGLKWGDIYTALEPHGVNVVGGRLNEIGVGGFVLGGGYSWKTNQYGLTIDTVVAFDLVTPTGKILHVTETSEPDLFFGLKGGLNNFGVVTSVTLETHPQTDVYGGGFLYAQDSLGELNKAVAAFDAANKDPKAQILYTSMCTAGQMMASVQIVYDGPTPPKGTFDGILAIPSIQGAALTAPWTGLLKAFEYELPFGRLSWIPETFMVSKYPLELLDEITAQVLAYGQRLQAAAPEGRFITISYVAEPFLNAFAHSRGGAFPHSPDQPTTPTFGFLWYTSDISLPSEMESELWRSYSRELQALTAAIREKATELGLTKMSDVLYANYAHADADASLVFGENFERLREIAIKYDPEKVMTLTDGFLVQKELSKSENTNAKSEL